jgi:D-lactate dehydrogenase (cytochrome)
MLLMEFHGSEAGVKEQAETVQDRRRARRGLRMGHHARGARGCGRRATTPTSPACRCAGLPRRDHRHLRADLAPGRDHRASVAEADASGCRTSSATWATATSTRLPDRPGDREGAQTAERLSDQMVQRAIALEGTCTGEHGIGLHKQGFLVDEAGAGRSR